MTAGGVHTKVQDNYGSGRRGGKEGNLEESNVYGKEWRHLKMVNGMNFLIKNVYISDIFDGEDLVGKPHIHTIPHYSLIHWPIFSLFLSLSTL